MNEVIVKVVIFPPYQMKTETTVSIINEEGWVFTFKATDRDAVKILSALISPSGLNAWKDAVTDYNNLNAWRDPEVVEPEICSGNGTQTFQLEDIDKLMALRDRPGFAFPKRKVTA